MLPEEKAFIRARLCRPWPSPLGFRPHRERVTYRRLGANEPWSNVAMNTTTPPAPFATAHNMVYGPLPLLDHGMDDGVSSDAASPSQLPIEQQLTRFLQWLQLTDRGHQPC